MVAVWFVKSMHGFFEASGIGLQQLFGLKCLRSDLVFIFMYLLFCVCFFFCSLEVFCLFVCFLAGGRAPVRTLDCQDLKNLRSFNINPSSCNLIVLLFISYGYSASTSFFFFQTNCLHDITVSFVFCFFKYPSSGMMCQLVNVFFFFFLFCFVCFHTKAVVEFYRLSMK